jgi:putative redox protein
VKIRTVSLRYEGAERFVGTTGTGRGYVYGDEIEGNEHSPVESVVASLAACTAMDVIAILNKKRQVVDRYDVEGPILLEHALRHAIELSATKYCPISAMLSAGPTEIHHRFRLRCTGLDKRESEGLVVVTGPFRRPEIVD